MDYRQLLKKYINHVGIEEGTTFLTVRGGWSDSPEFTDEEWAKLKELEEEPLVISAQTHSCSCHAKNAGPCAICKELGCLVWDFNHVAQPELDLGLPDSKKGCPSCDHDLSYPGQPGHECYTYEEWHANIARNKKD